MAEKSLKISIIVGVLFSMSIPTVQSEHVITLWLFSFGHDRFVEARQFDKKHYCCFLLLTNHINRSTGFLLLALISRYACLFLCLIKVIDEINFAINANHQIEMKRRKKRTMEKNIDEKKMNRLLKMWCFRASYS